jgi:acetoacetyl-CoA reductase
MSAATTTAQFFDSYAHDFSAIYGNSHAYLTRLANAATPRFVQAGEGAIVNISSVIGQAGGFGQTNYASAKAGLIGFTKSLALETARKGITVNAICPGFIGTEMVCDMPVNVQEAIIAQIPMKKLGQPADVARGVLFICESDYMTGQCLNLNGGLYMM